MTSPTSPTGPGGSGPETTRPSLRESFTPVGDYLAGRIPDPKSPSPQVWYEAGRTEALLSLAAELDRLADETAEETDAHAARGDEDAEFVAYGASGAWRAAAERARQRAQDGQGEPSSTLPVSQPAPDGSVDPGAALPPCPTPCDADCELNPDGCHEVHQVHEKRAHQPWACEDIRKAILARAVLMAEAIADPAAVTLMEDTARRFFTEHANEVRADERAKLQPAIDRVARLATAAQGKAVERAVRAERERCAQLAEARDAHYWVVDGGAEVPFADLIRKGTDG